MPGTEQIPTFFVMKKIYIFRKKFQFFRKICRFISQNLIFYHNLFYKIGSLDVLQAGCLGPLHPLHPPLHVTDKNNNNINPFIVE